MGSKQIVNGTLTPIGDISYFEDLANDLTVGSLERICPRILQAQN